MEFGLYLLTAEFLRRYRTLHSSDVLTRDKSECSSSSGGGKSSDFTMHRTRRQRGSLEVRTYDPRDRQETRRFGSGGGVVAVVIRESRGPQRPTVDGGDQMKTNGRRGVARSSY